MRKSYFIINPHAGNEKGAVLPSLIAELWKKAGVGYDIYITKDHKDIESGVRRALEAAAKELIIAGGDGTVLAAVNALRGAPMSVGVIPCGTGNDFVRSHGISTKIDEALLTVLAAGRLKEVDVGECNGSYFLNVASIGIDALIVKRTQGLKSWLKGPAVYLIASIIEIFTYTPMDISLTIDGVVYRRSAELVAIANGRFYGGGMEIAPMADATDAMYDIVLVRAMKKRRLLKLLPTLYAGNHIHEPEVELLKGYRIQITCGSEMVINLDGELSSGKILDVHEMHHKIKLITNI